jgi:uncharacterized protein Yka (UPF0111/DUF47 family)
MKLFVEDVLLQFLNKLKYIYLYTNTKQMEKTIEKLQPELVEKLRELKSKQSELLLNIGQVYLETKQLSKIQASLENEYDVVGSELQKELVELENKYPNAEIDLGEGTIIY